MRSYFYMAVIPLLMCSSYSAADSNPVAVFEINTAETYIQAPLEKEIYSFSHQPYLSDLQVRDAQGNSLPFRIVDASTQSKSIRREIPAIFFPVAPDTNEDTLRNLGTTRIQITADNMHVDIESNQPQVPVVKQNSTMQDQTIQDQAIKSTATQDPDFYLINLKDFSKTSNNLKIKQMILEWNYKESNQYQHWEVSASQDLHHWQKLNDTNLVWLEKEGQSLIQNQIALNLGSNDYHYLQLRCIEFCQGIRISAIKLVEEATEHFYPDDTHWAIKGQKSSSQKSIQLQHNDNWQSKSAWDFHRKDNAAINNVTINLGDQVYGDEIRILGKAKHKDSWKLVYKGIWFNTKVGAQWFSSNNLFSPRQDFTELRLEFATELRPELIPELIFHTSSKYIQFMGNQTPPYRLLVTDSSNTDAQARILNSLINNQSVSWVNHQWTFLNPENRGEVTSSISWRSILFWSLLLIAIGLLGWMTAKLFRQMNTHQN